MGKRLQQLAEEQTVCHTVVPQERTASHDRPMVLQEDAPNKISKSKSSTEQLQHAADMLARAGESAASLHEEQLAAMHNECRYVLEKLLDETVQGCVKYSIVKVAILQALEALGTKETEALWRDTCWTLRKIEEWLTAKDRLPSGKDTAHIAEAAQTILFGSAGTDAVARGSHDGS